MTASRSASLGERSLLDEEDRLIGVWDQILTEAHSFGRPGKAGNVQAGFSRAVFIGKCRAKGAGIFQFNRMPN